MRKTAVEQQREQEFRPQETMAQIHVATQHLKEIKKPRTLKELLNYMSIQHADPDAIVRLERTMKSGKLPKIEYDPKTDLFKYRSTLPVHDEESLKAYLQGRKTMIGVKVEEIKDGWPECVPFLESMAGRGEILLVRNKPKTGPQTVDFSSHHNPEREAAKTARDLMPKVVFPSDATLVNRVSEDIRKQWMSIPLPTSDETMRDRLIAAGLKPSTAAPTIVKATAGKPKRKPNRTIRGKLTNAAIPMKNYEHLRK